MSLWLTGRTFGVAPSPSAVWKTVAAGLIALVLALLFLMSPAAAADVEFSADEGFGRIVVSFPDRNLLPRHTASAVNGVLVLQFDEPVEMDVTRASIVLGGYVTIARADPDGRGARFALGRGVTINTMEAGARLFVDLLPPRWRGPPPRLPDSVIAELAQRVEEASRIARQAELLRIAGEKSTRLDIRPAAGPTFSRIAFSWNIPFEASFERRATGVHIRFDQTAPVDIGAVRAALPPFVHDITVSPTEEGGLSVLLVVDTTSDVRAFREVNTYIVDVQGDLGDEAEPSVEAAALLGAVSTGNDIPAAATDRVEALGVATPPPDRDEASEPETMVTPPIPDAPVKVAPAAAAAMIPAEPPEPSVDTEIPDGSDERVLADGVIRVEAKRIGQATRIVFPYEREIGSALFTRGPVLWAMFDDPSPIEIAPLQDALAGYARSIRVFRVGESQAVRIEMAEPLLATLNPDNTYWVITIGNMVIEPTKPLPLRRMTDDAGAVRLEVPFGPVANIHRLIDPEIGDEVLVVTGVGQPRGLIKPQQFVELDALSSAHGLAFVPRVDDLQTAVHDQVLRMTRPSGLSISTSAMPQRQSLLDLPGVDEGAKRPGFVDFSTSLAVDPLTYWQTRHDLAAKVAEAQEPAEVVEAWYETAKFHIANGLGAETLGALDLIASRDSEEETSDRMAVLRAGAEVLMGRPDDALALLARSELADSPDAAVWRAIALTDVRDYAAAHRAFVRGETVIDGFPDAVRRRFLLSDVRTAIELNDFGKARSLIPQLDPRDLSQRELSELELLNARSMDANGLPMEAVNLLSGVVRNGRGAPAAEATFRLVRLQRREGLITLDQAIDRLEQLAVSWRGDQTELDVLRAIGQMSLEKGDHRRAFETMRAAMQVEAESDTTRMMNEEMQGAFASLFLDGGANDMKPVDALALYYDFRELTPAGRRGDAMVRRLADRLVDVDLLAQAAELLSHQVENRLRGAARAEVAADLAMVYLLDKRPERALRTLARTRQPELPLSIERQRRTVEGRALADTGKPDLALDLLQPLQGSDIDRLRAEILWEADRHLAAGEQFERLLGARWSDDLPLTDGEQLDILKAGIAYTLVADGLSLDRLRSKFASKMALTPNALAFEAVTAPVSTAGASFDEVVRSIAAIDKAQDFLTEYRTRFRPSEDSLDDEPADPAVDAEPAASAEAATQPAEAAG